MYGSCDRKEGLWVFKVVPVMPLWHAQTEDGRWICETCYAYDLCVIAKSDPCSGLCGENKCGHRPKLISEWTFWTYHMLVNLPADSTIYP